MKRIGYYCWAGPTTIDMLKVKYFKPQIDAKSILASYDYDNLAQIKEVFGITDAWVTLYWGFGENRERQAEDFLNDKIDNFRKLDIKTHLYVQGTNLVEDEFTDKDLWARDAYGNTIPYFKGRLVTCVNNPAFQEEHKNRVSKAMTLGGDGIYIDNIQMGQMTLSNEGIPLTFCGCNCSYCQKKFKNQYEKDLPTNFSKTSKEDLDDYLKFRVDTVSSWIQGIKESIRGIELGTNFYDPSLDAHIVYGFDIERLSEIQDYVLFEHFTFPKKGNYVLPNIKQPIIESEKPVFSLPYKKPIGYDESYSQDEYNLLYSAYKSTSLNLCIKGSEFTTKKVWHNLNAFVYAKPSNKDVNVFVDQKANKVPSVLLYTPFSIRNYIYSKFINLIMDTSYFRPLMKIVYKFVIR